MLIQQKRFVISLKTKRYLTVVLHPQINELQRLDAQQREIQQALSVQAEKLVTGKIQKQAYLDQEQQLRVKMRDINTRISALVNQY